MKRLWPLVALGIGAFVLFALVTLPAGVVLSRLGSLGVVAGGVDGSIWSGNAQVLQIRGTNVGSVQWRVHPLALFTGRLTADLKIKRTDGFAETQLTVTPAGSIQLVELTAAFPLSALPLDAIRGKAGTLNARLARLELANGWPSVVEGTIEARDIVRTTPRPMNLGSYKVTFPPGAASSDALVGNLTDAGGPLQITGTLQLKADRSYNIKALVATRPDAPRDIAKALEFLGPPDAQGRREFGTEGTL